MNDNDNKTLHFLDMIQDEGLVKEEEKQEEGVDINNIDTKQEEVKEEEEEQEEFVIEEQESTEETDEFSLTPFAQHLIDNDIIIPAEGKEYDDNIESVAEMIQDTIHTKYEQFKSGIVNDTAQKFIDFLESGGSPDEFISNVSAYPDYSKVDIDDEDNQKSLIREYYQALEHDENDINEQIEEFEDSGSLTKHSKIALKFLTKKRDEHLANMIEEQKQAEQQRIKAFEQERENVKSFIEKNDNIGGIPVTKADKQGFADFLLKPVKKDEQGNMLSQYLVEMTEEDKLKMAFFKYKKFNFGDIERKIENKKTLELQKSLRKYKDPLATRNNNQEAKEEVQSNKIPSLPWLQ